MTNRNLVLVCGPSASGKTASLRNLKNPKGVIYLCCESGKELPFAADFKVFNVTHPLQVFDIFAQAEAKTAIHTIVIDSLDYLMDMYESQCVLTSTNTMQGWQDYQQFFKKLMQEVVASSRLNVIFTAHTMSILNENEAVRETMVKVKGALMNQGVESYFNNVISCKKIPLKSLEGMESPLLNITEEEEILNFKYVYQTRLTKKTVDERIRGPLGMWSIKEIFIDNDLQGVLDRLQEYYK
jgi:hypothetical protein